MGNLPRQAGLGYVLDDDAAILRLVCRMLGQYGMEAQSFATSVALFAALAERPADVLILDLALGSSDGIEVIRKLDQIGYRGKLLLISGRGELALAEVRKIGIGHGLAMLKPLMKPFRFADLIGRLADAPTEAEPAAPPVAPSRRVVLDVPAAIADDWLSLWYQPKFDLATGRLSGAEALIVCPVPTGVCCCRPISSLPREIRRTGRLPNSFSTEASTTGLDSPGADCR